LAAAAVAGLLGSFAYVILRPDFISVSMYLILGLEFLYGVGGSDKQGLRN